MQAKALPTVDPQPFELSLRIRHPSIDPAELSRQLKIEAEHAFRAGDPRPSGSSVASSSLYTESYWLGRLRSPASIVDVSFPSNPKSQIAQARLEAATQTLGWALSMSAVRFLARHATLLRRIAVEGGQISLLVSLSADEMNNFSLVPEASRVFCELGVTIEFEFTGD